MHAPVGGERDDFSWTVITPVRVISLAAFVNFLFKLKRNANTEKMSRCVSSYQFIAVDAIPERQLRPVQRGKLKCVPASRTASYYALINDQQPLQLESCSAVIA